MSDNLKILKNFSKPHWFEIIKHIKASQGLSINELSEKINLSYMGIKKHCIEMLKLGYLNTWRRPVINTGRPETVYQITKKLNPIFSGSNDETLIKILNSISKLDSNINDKVFFFFFQDQANTLSKNLKGETLEERSISLAKERTKLGYFSSYNIKDKCIEEYNNPFQSIFDKYPNLEQIELKMFSKLLNSNVKKIIIKTSGLYLYKFDLNN